MKSFRASRSPRLSGEITIPGDKSISHRAVMLSSLSEGEVKISNFLRSDDCLRTAACMRSMGIDISEVKSSLTVRGRGLAGLKKPADILYVGNSGTSIRLLLGILAGQPFDSTITGDDSIKKRPMDRVVKPLLSMGAKIVGRDNNEFAPLKVHASRLKGIEYEMPVASAQVKSAILLAGLFAEGKTTVTEKVATRDHTERMLEHFGVKIERKNGTISIHGGNRLKATSIDVPSDISSAAFLMVAAALIPGSDIVMRNVGVNPGRTGIIEVLHRMGALLEVFNENIVSGEPVADIRVRHSQLRGVELSGDIIPRIIDEIPAIALAGTLAQGETVIKDAAELRVKESDRISTTVSQLKKFGAKISATAEGMKIEGVKKLTAAQCESSGDHRIAMMCAVAGLLADGTTEIKDVDCVETSFPGFAEVFAKAAGKKCLEVK
jgi:3-phosphoshikimate 1-carboxyvinyltransferase